MYVSIVHNRMTRGMNSRRCWRYPGGFCVRIANHIVWVTR